MAEPTEVVLPTRAIPAPTTISPEAAATLAIRPARMAATPPEPTDKDGWRAFVEATEQAFSAQLQALEHRYPCARAAQRLARSTLYELRPDPICEAGGDAALLYLHPGGFTFCGGENAAAIATPVAVELGLLTYSLDYRMPPDHPFPAALDDAVDAYRHLLARHAPKRIIVAGRSAGGGLAASLLLKAQSLGLPMPAGCILQTPEADLTESGDTFETNLGLDNFVGRLTPSVALYADGHDLADPYLSPVYGSFTADFPPTILTSGTRDLFLSNTVLLHRALRRGGAEAELHVWEAMGHGGFMGAAPEDGEVWEELRRFVGRVLHRRPGDRLA